MPVVVSLPFRLIAGSIFVAIGVLLVVKTGAMITWTGPISWAEDKMGSGGTYPFLRLVGIVLIFFGFAFYTNLIGGFIEAVGNFFLPSNKRTP
ncbi:hypothetical protein HYV73_00560 [Candidatus Uhrbacteria bacterium]|nr:hypothetical protein [Candidatus Uhrbacteria bacterium]